LAPVVLAVDGRLHGLDLEPRAPRLRVPVEQPHNRGGVARMRRAHHEADPLSGPDAPHVAVADDVHGSVPAVAPVIIATRSVPVVCSCTSMSATFRPRRITTTRSATRRTCCMLWLMKRIPTPCALSRSTSDRTS